MRKGGRQKLTGEFSYYPVKGILQRRLKVAFIVSRFPKITETFILFEMLAIEQHATSVELYPLLRERITVVHPEAVPFVQRAHFQPFLSWSILRAHWHFLTRKPGVYLRTLGRST